jgi:hypothetical protein
MASAARMRAWAVLITAAGVGVTACTLMVDTSNLYGSGDGPAQSSDGGTESTSPGADASADGAPVNAADAADAAAFSCTALGTAPLFCDDFDTSALQSKWSKVDADGYTLAFDTKKFVSAPRSVQLAIDFDGGTATASQSLEKTFGQSYSELTLAFDAAIDTGVYWFIPIRVQGLIDGADVKSDIGLLLEDGKCTFQDEAYDYTHAKTVAYSSPQFPVKSGPGRWHHFEITVKVTQPASATIEEDGVEVFTTALHTYWRSFPPTIGFGHYYVTGAAAATSVHLDNVVVYGKP